MRDAFVGRGRELGELRAAIQGALAGRGSITLVSGEPGIGKTRLVEAAVDGAPDVRWANCWEGPSTPFWPWSQLVGPTFEDLVDVGSHADGDASPLRFALFDAITTHLRSTDIPLVLVIDDLHWADIGSLRLLEFFSRDLRSSRIAVIGTYRGVEAAIDPEVGSAIEQVAEKASTVRLTGLIVEEVSELLESATGTAPREELALAVYSRTEGNPLFVRELGRLIAAQGEDTPGSLPIPEGVQGVIKRRLARLSEPTRTLLQLASVIGSEFRTDVLARSARLDVGDALRRLDEAESAKIVAPSERFVARYVFSHALVRDVLYEALPSSVRSAMHRTVGEAIEEITGRDAKRHSAELAHHFRQSAVAGQSDKAIAYSVEAGRRSLEQLAYEEAVDHFKAALEVLGLTPDDEQRSELLLELGDACLKAGDLPAARDVFTQAATIARARQRPDELARSALGFGAGLSGFEVQLADQVQLDLLNEALTALPKADSSLRARLLARQSVALSLQESVERRRAAAQEAVDMSRRVGDRRALAYALAALCDATAGPTDCEARIERAEEIVQIASADGDRPGELLGRRLLVVAFLEKGDLAAANQQIVAFERVATAIKQPLYSWYVPLWRGMQAFIAGRYDEANRLADEALQVGARAHSVNAAMLACVLRWMVLYQQGRFDESLIEAELMLEVMGGVGAIYTDVLRAVCAALSGRTEEARPLLRALRDGIDGLDVDSEWLPTMCQWSEGISAVGDTEACEITYERLLPVRHLFGVEGIGAASHGSMEYHLGILARALGRDDDARTHLERAIEANERLGAPVHAARARSQLGVLRGSDRSLSDSANLFRREGELWILSYEGVVVRVKDAKGLHDIVALLARPGVEIAALDLISNGAVVVSAGSLETLDEKARELFKQRLRDLEEEIESAEALSDTVGAERGRAERDALVHELTSAYGLGGRARRAGDPSERARTTVTRRIRDAIGRIAEVHPSLGRHLQNSVRTGTFCSYVPEQTIDWTF